MSDEKRNKNLGVIAGIIFLFAAIAFISSKIGFGVDLLSYIPVDWLPYVMAFAFTIGAWRLGALEAIKNIWD